MSVHISISRSKEPGMLTLSYGTGCHIEFTELRIRPMANLRTPHELLGCGRARIALTDEELVVVVAEYLRFVIHENVNVERKQIGWNFSCKKEVVA